MTRIGVPVCLVAMLLLPVNSQAQIDHLEVLETPRLVDCGTGLPYFRVVVNAVDANGGPLAVGVPPEEAKRKFQVLERNSAHTIQYVGLFESGGQAKSPGNYVMLLIDLSGSMNAKLPRSGQTRFAAAKAAMSQSLENFAEGVDHIAVAPFDSHEVVSRIRGASFQSTRQGVLAQIAALPAPKANTALYTAVSEALPILKQQADAGYAVSLVVFSDGENDVNRPGDDRGLLGDEGLGIVRNLASQLKIPITTVGFGVGGKAATVSALRNIAWPTPESYYDAETNPKRLSEIFTIARKKLADRIHILFGGGKGDWIDRGRLAGQSIPLMVKLRTADGNVAIRSEAAWEAPAVGVPVFESKCTEAEVRAVTFVTGLTDGGDGGSSILWRRLVVLAMFSGLLAALWFGAPRLVWPESYIPKPTFNRPVSGIREVDAVRAPASFPPRSAAPPIGQPRGGGPAMPRHPTSNDGQTIVIPPRGPSAAAPSPRQAPRPPEPPASRADGDETIYRPPSKNPKDR